MFNYAGPDANEPDALAATKFRDVTDGLSTTMAIVEHKIDFRTAHIRGLIDRASFGPHWFGPPAASPYTNMRAILVPPNIDTTRLDRSSPFWGTGVLPPSSFHTGGLQVLMADGSVRFISDNISAGSWFRTGLGLQMRNPSVWQALATRNGGEIIGEF